MRAHYLQHVTFEGLGSIAEWLDDAGYTISATRLFEGQTLPSPDAVDLLIVMGGPMSVNDEALFPWLVAEKTFVRACIARGIPTLGICLGAQLIASASGSRVYANARKEIGWFPVEGVPGTGDAFRFPASVNAFHWHGETFLLPPGTQAVPTVHLARSAACEHQAFQLGRRTIGLQFHLEATPDATREMVSHCRSELVPADFVQSEEAILAAPAARYRAANALMGEVLAYLVG